MQNSFARTDIAAEAAARIDSGVSGVEADELHLHGLYVSRVLIKTPEAAEAVGKPQGKYLTIEMEEYTTRRCLDFSSCVLAMRDILRAFSAIESGGRFLIACLGNSAVTPDAIGPCTADKLIVTRHMKDSLPDDFAAFSSTAVLRTGVLGTTGIESADMIANACHIVKPDCLIVIDALAAAEPARLCRNIQLCDSGIAPGSGVGNDRAAIDSAAVGCPVVAIGVPTVTDAVVQSESCTERLFVTPRNIDELVRSMSKIIAYGINLALHSGLGIGDIETLVE